MNSSSRTWKHLLCLIGTIVLATLPSRRVDAQHALPDRVPNAVAEAEAEPTTADTAATDPEQREKRRKALAAAYVLGGLAFVGGAMCVLVMIWGRRIRRIVRTPTPPQQPPDEFWYLRTNQMKKRLEQKRALDRTDADTDVS